MTMVTKGIKSTTSKIFAKWLFHRKKTNTYFFPEIFEIYVFDPTPRGGVNCKIIHPTFDIKYFNEI